MECAEVAELLDAYSLGAAEPDEAAALEEHVADCVRCWSSLNEAQRIAATIALSSAFQRAPPSLRERILKETEKSESPSALSVLGLVRKLWPAGVGVLAAGAAASLAFAFVLQAEVNDLRDDNDQLVAEIEDAGEQLTDQRQLMAVLAAPDVQQVTLDATDPTSSAVGVYHWSKASKRGALLCDNLPVLQQGQVYEVWIQTADGIYSVGAFQTWNGLGQLSVDLQSIDGAPLAIGMSIEDADSTAKPDEMFLFAEFRR